MNKTRWALGLASAVVGALTAAVPQFANEIPRWAYGVAMVLGPTFVAVSTFLQANELPGE